MARTYRIGVMGGGPGGRAGRPSEALIGGLATLGYVEGQNLEFEFRPADPGDEDADARELAGLGIDLLVAPSTTAAMHAHKVVSDIPVAFWSGDAVASGLVESLDRPGGNLTGVSIVGSWHDFDLLTAILPGIQRVTLLWNRNYTVGIGVLRQAEEEAEKRGLTVSGIEILEPAAFAPAFETLTQGRAQAVLDSNHPIFARQPELFANKVQEYRIPSMGVYRSHAEHGGLLSRGPDFATIFYVLAEQIDRILRGADPAATPVLPPSRFDYTINLKAAKALGLTIPPAILEGAHRLIAV